MLRYFIWFCCFRVVLAEEWNCSATSGKYTLSSDCVVSSQVEVTGILSLTGVVNASGVLPRVIGGGSNRLFYVGSGGKLILETLILTEGNVAEKDCYNFTNVPWYNQNKAFGAITLLIAGLCSSGMFGIDGI